MHTVGELHDYHLVDSNEMHPNFRQVKVGRKIHFRANKIWFFKPLMFTRSAAVQENKPKSQGIRV